MRTPHEKRILGRTDKWTFLAYLGEFFYNRTKQQSFHRTDQDQIYKSGKVGNPVIMSTSKQLGHENESGFIFVKKILENDATYAIDFDRFQKHPNLGYII